MDSSGRSDPAAAKKEPVGAPAMPSPENENDDNGSASGPGAVIRPYGYAETECGYCKGSRASLLEKNGKSKDPTNCSKSYSVLADTMTPSVYEGFMNRGWRRSGIHLYKPCNFESCCPTITIRLNVQNFHPTKSQRKVSNKMTNLLLTTKEAASTKTKPSNNKRPLPSPKRISSSISNASVVVRSSEILKDLEAITKKAVTDVLVSILNDHTIADDSKNKSNNNWKTSYRLLQQSKQDCRDNQAHAVSVVCAQLSGMYRNVEGLKFPSRDELVRTVVDKMISNIEEETMKHDQHSRNNKKKNILQSKNGKVEVSSIEGDAKSGQIRVVLHVSSATSIATGDKDGDVALDEGGGENVRGYDDKLDQWCHERNAATSMTITSTSINNSGDVGLSGNSCSSSNDQFHIPEKKQRLGSSVSPASPNSEHDGSQGHHHHGPAVKKELTITTVAAHQSALMPEVHRLYSWYQNKVHGDDDPFAENNPNETTTESTTDPMETDSNDNSNNNEDYEIDLEEKEDSKSDIVGPADLDWGNAPTYFKEQIHGMLKKYLCTINDAKKQQRVLKNYYSFYQFLVEAPFPFKRSQQTKPIDASSTGGLYHQQYRLGGVLIAVGVVDILPSGLSSVYLYYDPIFSQKFVPMGKYAILKEIEYTRQTLKLPYYYLGYYIESCRKMRYKAEYRPSELLCPTFYRWVDADIAIPKLQKTPLQVCSLVDGPGQRRDDDDDDDDDGPKNDDDDDETTLNSGIQMDIGAGLNVTMEMLQPSGIDIVKPILSDFLKESSSELAVQCVVKLS